MKRWLAVLGVLLAGALLLPQHAWSQGAVVNNGLQLQGTPLNIQFYDGTYTGTLQPATLTGNRTWTLPDASGEILLSSTIGTTAWLLTGNSITGTEFLGTTNAQPLVIRTDNIERMRVTETGNVGIGTTSPLALLHVAGTGLFEGNLTVDGNTTLGDAVGDRVTVNAGTVELPNIPSGSAATEVLVWDAGEVKRRDASGLVGAVIGTTAWLLTGNSITGTEFLGTTNAQPLVIRTDNIERMRVTETGNVGIGTTSPLALLHVAGTGLFEGNLTVDGNTTLGDAVGDRVTVNAGTVELPNIPSGSAATEVLVWDAGEVKRRDVSSLIGAVGGWLVGGNPLSSNGELGTTTGFAVIFITNNTEGMRLTADQRLDFQGGTGAYRIDLPNNSNIAIGRVRANGFATYSSLRWKEDIRPIGNALERVMALRGVNFRWKPEYGGGEDIGFIMEEVDRVVPEVVDRDERTGELLGMDYSRLTALLVEALKQHVRTQEQVNARLQQENAELRQRVERLESLVEQLLRQSGERGAGSQPSTIQDAWLGQNIPNPFAGTTTIPYYIPAGVSRAELVVRDVGGRELKRLELAERGAHGQVVLEMGLMGSGTYEYALVLDGRVVAVKQMTLMR